MDIVGILRGWKVFDHAGHLGGVLFAVYVPLSIATDYYNIRIIITYGFYHYHYACYL